MRSVNKYGNNIQKAKLVYIDSMYMLTMESVLQNCRGKDTFESRLSFRKCVKNSTDTDQLDEYLIYVRIKQQNVGTRKT